jgi:hypothetical protein
MFHGGVLAMRVCFCCEINFAEDASFLEPQFDLPPNQQNSPNKNPTIHRPTEFTPVTKVAPDKVKHVLQP